MSKDYTNEAYGALLDDYNRERKQVELDLGLMWANEFKTQDPAQLCRIKRIHKFIEKWAKP